MTGTIAAMQAAARELDGYRMGYDQGNRWDIRPGGECDCSSGCGTVCKRGGYSIVLTGTFYTGNWAQRAKDAGFTILRWTSLADIREGDFIVCPGHHIEFAYSTNRWWSARNDENGRAFGGKSGNQGGRENVGWGDPYDMSKGGTRTTYVCRPPDSELRIGDKGARVAALQADLLKTGHGAMVAAAGGADGDFGSGTALAVVALQVAAGLKADGIVGPQTREALAAALATPAPVPEPVPEPVPVPEPTPVPPVAPVGVTVRVATLNCHDPRFGGSTADERVNALADVVASFDAQLVALTECPDLTKYGNLRSRLVKELPGGASRWKVIEDGRVPAVAILIDSKSVKYPQTPGAVIAFGSAGYHGAIAAKFTIGGQMVTFCAYHLQPNTIASDATQIRQVRQAAEAVKALGGTGVLAGDGVNSNDWLPDGWRDARNAKHTTSTPTYKNAITDRIHVLGPVTLTAYGVRKTTATDHNGPVAAFTLTSPQS